jgi:DNA replication protein DnaC
VALDKLGAGVIFAGPVGTGKSLLAAIGARAIVSRWGVRVEWLTGSNLFARLRSFVSAGEDDQEFIDDLASAAILVLDDLVPPAGCLTEFQAAALLRIVDARYTAKRPTWATLNVKGGEEAAARIGGATYDRLRENAVTVFCDWQSHRQAMGQQSLQHEKRNARQTPKNRDKTHGLIV